MPNPIVNRRLSFSIEKRLPFSYGNVVQYLSGIVGNEMIDISGNNYHADIINKDFYINGIPYKSAALISQKSENFGLIPDPTNFWYTTGGTPNQIPVVSLYQNIDYENQIFCNHVAQALGSNGVETTEPFVYEIVTYSSALTGINLTNASVYFGVPTEVTSNVIWVDWVNGLDTNPGTKLLPFKTLTKANTGTANKTIYCKTGAYADTASIFFLGGQIWYFIGYCTTSNTATPAFSTSASSSNFIQGAIISPPSGGRAVYFISGNNNTVNRCKITSNGNSSKCFQQLAGTGNVVKYSVLISNNDQPTVDVRATGVDLYGNSFSGTQNGASAIITFNTTNVSGDVNVRYNKFTNTLRVNQGLFNFGVNGNYYINYNKINTDAGATLQTVSSSITGALHWKYNIISSSNLTSGVIIILDRTVNMTCDVSYNSIVISSGTVLNGIITLLQQDAPVINGNLIDVSMFVSCISINSTAVKSPASISYNIIMTRADGAQITLGSDADATYDNGYNSSEVIGNKIYGYLYYDPSSATNLGHGIAIFNCIDVKVKYNYVNGANHLVVYKASDRVTAMANTDAVCQYNIGINNDAALFPKTMSGIVFYNNTCYADNDNIVNIPAGIYLLGSSGSANNNTFKNNIFIDLTSSDSNKSLIRIDPPTTSGLVSDNNIFYSLNNAIAKIVNPGVLTYSTLPDWQALGYDLNSVFMNVTFESVDNGLFYTTEKLFFADNLGAGYEIGLNIATKWPEIITENQQGNWQNGAYVLT